MANLKDKLYEGKGGAWLSANGSPKVAAQGSIQLGGRTIALTFWFNNRGGSAPHYNITVNEQKTLHDDVVWFRSLHPDAYTNNALIDAARGRDVVKVNIDSVCPKHDPDDDIPF